VSRKLGTRGSSRLTPVILHSSLACTRESFLLCWIFFSVAHVPALVSFATLHTQPTTLQLPDLHRTPFPSRWAGLGVACAIQLHIFPGSLLPGFQISLHPAPDAARPTQREARGKKHCISSIYAGHLMLSVRGRGGGVFPPSRSARRDHVSVSYDTGPLPPSLVLTALT